MARGISVYHNTHKEVTQPRIYKDECSVQQVMDIISNSVNPYKSSDTLSSLMSGVVAKRDTDTDLLMAKDKGEEQFQKFGKERLIHQSTDFYASLPFTNEVKHIGH